MINVFLRNPVVFMYSYKRHLIYSIVILINHLLILYNRNVLEIRSENIKGHFSLIPGIARGLFVELVAECFSLIDYVESYCAKHQMRVKLWYYSFIIMQFVIFTFIIYLAYII